MAKGEVRCDADVTNAEAQAEEEHWSCDGPPVLFWIVARAAAFFPLVGSYQMLIILERTHGPRWFSVAGDKFQDKVNGELFAANTPSSRSNEKLSPGKGIWQQLAVCYSYYSLLSLCTRGYLFFWNTLPLVSKLSVSLGFYFLFT